MEACKPGMKVFCRQSLSRTSCRCGNGTEPALPQIQVRCGGEGNGSLRRYEATRLCASIEANEHGRLCSMPASDTAALTPSFRCDHTIARPERTLLSWLVLSMKGSITDWIDAYLRGHRDLLTSPIISPLTEQKTRVHR